MDTAVKLRALAALGALSTVAALGVLPSQTLAAGALSPCGNLTVKIVREYEPGKKQEFPVKVKAISTRGVSCAAAKQFLKLVYSSTNGKTPEHYKCTNGHFKVPLGFVPTVCTHGGARIQYGGQGG